jgi:hypothetical protein
MLPPLTEQEQQKNLAQNRPPRRRSFWRSVVEVVVLLVLIVGVIAGYYRETRLPFDSSTWKAATQSAEGIERRGRMCDDLLAGNRLIGMTQTRVIELLGLPDSNALMKEWDIGYTVGHAGIDPLFLVLKFDSNDRVVAYDIQSFG